MMATSVTNEVLDNIGFAYIIRGCWFHYPFLTAVYKT